MRIKEALNILNSFEYSDLGGAEFVKRYPPEYMYEEAFKLIEEAIRSAEKYVMFEDEEDI